MKAPTIWDAVGPKSENSRKWLGEGAKELLEVQKRVWVVQKTLGRPLLPGPKRVKKTCCTLSSPLSGISTFRAISQVHSIPTHDVVLCRNSHMWPGFPLSFSRQHQKHSCNVPELPLRKQPSGTVTFTAFSTERKLRSSKPLRQ